MSDEPDTKKQKTDEPTGWEGHTLNTSEALMKADEGRHFVTVIKDDVATLQGIGPLATKVLDALGIQTIEQLAKYKYFLMARAIKTLAETETKGGRPTESVMNVDKAVDKEWEAKTLTEMCDAPTEALEGIAKDACELLESLGCKTIGDLADLKYCRWAEAMVVAAKYENNLTVKERKLQAQLKKLS
jgi:nucleotidyltransferase/DNA polymerase involved in DNA repair